MLCRATPPAGWVQVFTDQFVTDAALGQFLAVYGARWGAYNAGETASFPDTSGHGHYSPAQTLSVSGGLLDIWLHTVGGIHMVSAPYPKVKGQATASANGQVYGRYEIIWRCDSLHGYKVVPLLWPDSDNMTADGEFDNPEANCDGTISAFMHRPGGGQDSRSTAILAASGWHTSVTEWLPGSCKFFLDNVQMGAEITANVPTTSFHWVLQCETSTDGTIPADVVSGHVQIDSVTVYTAS